MTAERNAENKITALELREQELQAVIQHLSVDLQNVSFTSGFDWKIFSSTEVRLHIDCEILRFRARNSSF